MITSFDPQPLTEFSRLSNSKPDPTPTAGADSTQSASESIHRGIRSFVLRAGRMTVAQERAWRDLWPQFGLAETNVPFDLNQVFGRDASRTLEIGFGNGESLADLAAAHPERDYLGIEVHRPGVGHLLLRCESGGLRNVRVICSDAVEVLRHRLDDDALDEVLLYFPDPWHKKRHHKRRIVQAEFVALVARKLRPGGVLRMATDWQEYAEHMLAVAGACPALRNLSAGDGYMPRPASRPITRFERRGHRLGHCVWDLAFERTIQRDPG
jgi:tRNA (guanine-N7-)-methyltransferase